jgi:hypothetical protein
LLPGEPALGSTRAGELPAPETPWLCHHPRGDFAEPGRVRPLLLREGKNKEILLNHEAVR